MEQVPMASQGPIAIASDTTPYTLHLLADDLPLSDKEHPNVKITCVESWEENLYIGTSSHEILHFVSIPATPRPGQSIESFRTEKPTYIQAFRFSPPTAPSAAAGGNGDSPYIQQILLLPKQLRALVLSSTGYLTFYNLPEFSPAFDGKVKVRDIRFMVLDSTDNQDEEEGTVEDFQARGRQVMLCGKKSVRIIKVGIEARLVRQIDFPGTIHAARQGPIACVATETDYSLLHIENSGKIDLSPIVSSNVLPSAASIPPEPLPAPIPEHPSRSSSRSGRHPPRLSSLQRPRSGDFSARNSSSGNTLSVYKHTRATSTGSMQKPPRSSIISGRESPQSVASAPSRTASPRNLMPPPMDGSSKLATAPASMKGSLLPSPLIEHPPPLPPSTTSKSPPPSPSTTPPPASNTPPQEESVGPSNPTHSLEPVITKLKPHIVAPSADEFLITTGTAASEPGMGVYFNTNGDLMPRGTITFEHYPETLMLDKDGWLLALLMPEDGKDLVVESFHYNGETTERGRITIPAADGERSVGIKHVNARLRFLVEDIGSRLMYARVELPGTARETASEKSDSKRLEQEYQNARRISEVQSRILIWDTTRIWGLVQRPLVGKLDNKLPQGLARSNFEAMDNMRKVLSVLEEISTLQPETELQAYEVEFIRQKSALLLLSSTLTTELSLDAGNRAAMQTMLLESGLDPRIVVSLFPAYRGEVVEGSNGLWAYAGIKRLYDILIEYEFNEDGAKFTRRLEAQLILKDYLMAWRKRKGFGSVADEKGVFLTIDAALLLVLLDIQQISTGSEDAQEIRQAARRDTYGLVDGGIDCFDRAVEILRDREKLYLLSWLYQSRRMSYNVLQTWQKIIETGVNIEEFEDGEERMKDYLIGRKSKEVVLEFGIWLSKRNPQTGVKVFIDTRSKVTWDPDEVLQFLRKESVASYRIYLEHLVVDSKMLKYSDELIFIYLDELIDTVQNSPETAEALQSSYEAYRALELPKPTYRRFIADNSLGDNWWLSRMRLLELLGEESGYDSGEVLKRLQPWKRVFVAELVILYGRESKHLEALQLLVHDLKDFDTAINYCLFGSMSIFHTKQGIASKEAQRSLLAMLLVEFLKIEDYRERLDQTSSFLCRFGSYLDIDHVLGVIPDSWSVELLSGFLTSALRHLIREKNETVVAKALSRSLNLKVNFDFIQTCDEIGPTVQN